MLVWGAQNTGTSTAIRALYPGYSSAGVTANAVAFSAPMAGSLRNLYFNCVTGGTGSGTMTYMIYKNGAPTGLIVTVAQTATAGSDTLHSASFVAGDKLACVCVGSGNLTGANVDAFCSVEVF
jgi:hypothetical protein